MQKFIFVKLINKYYYKSNKIFIIIQKLLLQINNLKHYIYIIKIT